MPLSNDIAKLLLHLPGTGLLVKTARSIHGQKRTMQSKIGARARRAGSDFYMLI